MSTITDNWRERVQPDDFELRTDDDGRIWKMTADGAEYTASGDHDGGVVSREELEAENAVHTQGTPTSTRDHAVPPTDERARREATARATREKYFGRRDATVDWFWRGVLPGRSAACLLGVGPGAPEFLADMAARVTTEADWLDGSEQISPEVREWLREDGFEPGEDVVVVVVGSFADAVFDASGGNRANLWHLPRVNSFDELIKVLNDARLWPVLLAIPNLHQIVPAASLRSPKAAQGILSKLTALTSRNGACVYGWPRSVRGPRDGEHWSSLASATFTVQQRNGAFVVAGAGREFAFTVADGVLKSTAMPQAELTATAWLETFLSGGPKPRADVMSAGANAGFTERQLKYAATSLHVAAQRAKCIQAGTVWELPGWNL